MTSLAAPPWMRRQTWRLLSKQCELLQATSMAPLPVKFSYVSLQSKGSQKSTHALPRSRYESCARLNVRITQDAVHNTRASLQCVTRSYHYGCRKQAKQRSGMQKAAPATYEEQLPYLHHADLPTEDERNYASPQVGPAHARQSCCTHVSYSSHQK